MNDKHYFDLTRKVSYESDYAGNAHIGAVLVYHGSVLAKAANTAKTHTNQKVFNIVSKRYTMNDTEGRYLPERAHAECLLLAKCKYLAINWSQAHIYVYRELKNGRLAISRPCVACMAAIRSLGIKHIHYTTYDGFCHEVLK